MSLANQHETFNQPHWIYFKYPDINLAAQLRLFILPLRRLGIRFPLRCVTPTIKLFLHVYLRICSLLNLEGPGALGALNLEGPGAYSSVKFVRLINLVFDLILIWLMSCLTGKILCTDSISRLWLPVPPCGREGGSGKVQRGEIADAVATTCESRFTSIQIS